LQSQYSPLWEPQISYGIRLLPWTIVRGDDSFGPYQSVSPHLHMKHEMNLVSTLSSHIYIASGHTLQTRFSFLFLKDQKK
jgi:hypothetical protein